MREELVIDALQMAVKRRRPDPGVIHRSDQGGQYVSLGHLADRRVVRVRQRLDAGCGPEQECAHTRAVMQA